MPKNEGVNFFEGDNGDDIPFGPLEEVETIIEQYFPPDKTKNE
jgi:hypothetical protein